MMRIKGCHVLYALYGEDGNMKEVGISSKLPRGGEVLLLFDTRREAEDFLQSARDEARMAKSLGLPYSLSDYIKQQKKITRGRCITEVLTEDGKSLAVFRSMADALRGVGIYSKNNVSKALEAADFGTVYKGYRWRRISEKRVKQSRYGTFSVQASKVRVMRKPVTLVSPDGKEMHFRSMMAASTFLGYTNNEMMRRHLQGRAMLRDGYTARYDCEVELTEETMVYNERKKTPIRMTKGEEVLQFESLSAAVRYFKDSTLYRRFYGNMRYKGYKIEKEE